MMIIMEDIWKYKLKAIGIASAIILFLFIPALLLAADFTAKTLGDYGNVTVMEVAGNYDAKNPDGSLNSEPRQVIVKEFFRLHKDEYDFLVIFTNFDFQMPDAEARAFYSEVKNDTQGIGRPIFDNSFLFGSNGKLQGAIDMGNVSSIPATPIDSKFEEALETLSHEVLHRWGAYLKFRDSSGNISTALLGKDDSHWSFLLDSKGSVLYGNQWQDNGNGTFTSIGARKYYSPLDLYLMGFIDKSQVPPMLLIDNPDIDPRRLTETGITISGTPRYITIDNIIAAEGERIPGPAGSQKTFKSAFILITAQGTFTGYEAYIIENLRNGHVTRFSILTDGKGLMQVASAPKEDIPVNSGVITPPAAPRTLPPNIEDGVRWLMNNQGIDGSWMDLPQTINRDTAEAVIALKNFDTGQQGYSAGLQWLNGASLGNTDYLSRRIAVMAGAGQDASALINELLSRQNADGGWGSNRTYMSSPVDTSFALNALLSAGYSGQNVISKAITYLKSKQNPDGGWGSNDAGSAVEATARALSAFNSYQQSAIGYQLNEQIAKGAAWLIQRQNPDGGFGNSPSTVYDTAIAVLTLKELDASADAAARGLGYLLNLQSNDGSWYGSPYQTALAINAVWKATIDPDLSIRAQDITFIPSTVKSLPVNIVINANIWNLGRTAVPLAKVSLYDGEPSLGIKLGEQSLSFPGQSPTTVTFSAAITDGNEHRFYISVEPEGIVNEPNKANNIAVNILKPDSTYDFEALSSDITVSQNPVNIFQDVKISSKITNKGTMNAYNVQVKYYIDEAGIPFDIATATVDIPAGATISNEITWRTSKSGVNLPITVYADSFDNYTEISEGNNKAFAYLTVNSSTEPNITVSYRDITLTPNPANERGSVNISALVKNEGFSAANNINVNFYKGVPGAGGVLLGSAIISSLNTGENSRVSLDWANILESGERIIYVQADPENLIREIREDDNDAFAALKILSLPDFAVSTNSIAFIPSAPKEGDAVSINVTVKNLGEQDASNITVRAYEGNTVIGTQTIPLISGNSQAAVSFAYNTTGRVGAHEITVAVDPDNAITEQSEDNNRASRAFGVQDANLWVTEKHISPNGDDGKDSTQFFFRLNTAQTVKIVIVNEKGAIVRTFIGPEFENSTGGSITWDGLNDNGMVVDDGQYQMQIVDANNNILGSLLVTVDNNRSPLTKAIGTKHLLNNNLTCMLPDIWDWEWFPDESGIIFRIPPSAQNTTEYQAGLYTMSPSGDDIQRIVPWEWISEYDLSKDGERVAFAAINNQTGLSQLWVVDRDGRNLTLLDSVNYISYYGIDIRGIKWSPDREHIIYFTRRDTADSTGLWIIKSDGTGKAKIDPDGGYIGWYEWSPDSQKIAYLVDTWDANNGYYYPKVRGSDTSGNKREIFNMTRYGNYFEWLNNEKIVLLMPSDIYNWTETLWIIDASGAGNNTGLSDDIGEISISKDRQSIAFNTSANDNAYLNISDINGNINTIHESKSTNPDYSTEIGGIIWSSDGSKIAFIEIEADMTTDGEGGTVLSRKLVVIDRKSGKKASFEMPYQFLISGQLAGWMSDNVSIIGWSGDYRGYSIFTINSLTGESVTLISDVNGIDDDGILSPLERYITYYKAAELTSVCYGSGSYSDLWAMSSLLNLTADLRVSKQKSAVIMKGIAADLNFEGYALEYADAKTPTQWNLVAPPSDMPVINDVFTTWVPPYEGTFHVRLTVWDKAGNKAIDRKRISWGFSSSITNLYKSLEIFSPNGDGVKDMVELHYTVLEPVNLEFYVYDENNNLVTTIPRDYTSPASDYITWDGRDSSGRIVPDGKYKIKVFDFEFFVALDNTPPEVGISLSDRSSCNPPAVSIYVDAIDKNFKEWTIEYGEGENPQEWYPWNQGYEQLKSYNEKTDMLQSISTFSEANPYPIEWLVGKKFRITGEDFAGNRSSAVTSFFEEKIILYGFSYINDIRLIEGKDFIHWTEHCIQDKKYLLNKINAGPIDDIEWSVSPAHITGIETIRLPINTMILQYTQQPVTAFTQWIDVETVTASAGSISERWKWYNTISTLKKPFALRIKAVDLSGKEHYSNTIYSADIFRLDVMCKANPFPNHSKIDFENNTSKKFKLIKFQAISNEDPAYNKGWKDIELSKFTYSEDSIIEQLLKEIDTSNICDFAFGGLYSERNECLQKLSADKDSIPAGSYGGVYTPVNQFKTGMTYTIRMIGITADGEIYESDNKEIYPPKGCIDLDLTIEHKEAECGLISGKAKISVVSGEGDPREQVETIIIEAIRNYGIPRTLSYYIHKPDQYIYRPEERQLLREFDIAKEGLGNIDLDTSNMAEGRYPIEAVLTYSDKEDNIVKSMSTVRGNFNNAKNRYEILIPEDDTLFVDRILPDSQITYPGKNLMVCPITVYTNNGNWPAVPVEGIAEDNTNVKRYELYYGVGDNPVEWLPALTRKFNSNNGQVRGQLGLWDVTNLKGTTFSLKLKVIDVAGNVSCYTTSFSIDNLTEITNLARDNYLISPNGDGVLDDVNISYEINENSTVDVKVFKLLQGAGGAYVLDTSAPVRTIVSGLQHLSGTETASWDGRGDSGTAAPDGKYGIAVFATDSCGNTNIKWVAVEADNTPPTTIISYPRPVDPISNIVEVKGTAEDVHFQSYILEYGQGDNPDAWLLISTNTIPVKDNILGKWNTFGLDGRWTLRLTAQDSVGNRNTTIVTIDLGVRKTLIKDLDAAPRLLSPNSDGRLDAAGIKYELTDACDVKIELLDSANVVKKTYATAVQSAGVYTYTWDGRDDAGTVVPDGAYTVKLTATLSSNTSVTQTEAVTVSVDTTLPTIDIKQPLNDSYIRTDISVNGIISDKNLLEYSVVNTGGAGAATLDQGNQSRENYTFGILNELSEGRYSLNVRAKDLGENIIERNIIFTIDKMPPRVILDAPKDGEYYGSALSAISYQPSANINITGSIIENNLETFSLRYGSGENPVQWTNLLTGNTIPTNPQLIAWKVGKNDGIPDGLYTLSLYAKDKAGAEAEVRLKVTIDNTLPEASITSLKDNDYVRAALDIKGTASDANLDKYTIEISEGNCSSAYKWAAVKTANNSVRDNLLSAWQTIPPDGDYCLRLTVTDKVGNKAEAKVNIKVDTMPPAAPALSGNIENKTDARLNWTQNTEPDFAGCNIYRDNQKVNTDLIKDITYLEPNLKEGIYTYTVKALDLAGNESKASNEVKLKVDLTGPDARIRSQQDGTMVSGLMDIKGTAYSSDDFKQYRVYIGNGATPATWSLIRTSPVPIPYGTLAQWDTIGLSEGLYSIKLEAEDLSGNINIHQITAAIDNTPPAAPVLISAIANGSDATAVWQANTEPDLAGYLLYRNDQLVNVSGIVIGNLKPYLITGTTYPDRALPDGRFKYYLIAMDQAGNMSGQSNVIEVNIDTHASKADIVEPLDRSKFQNKTFIKAESSDLDIASIQFQYKAAQDSAWLNLGIPAAQMPYAAYLDPAVLGLTYGDYNLRAVATDLGAKTDPSPSFITITYTDLTPPAAPISLKALTNGRDVALTWTANTETDLDGYNLYRISGTARTKINASIIKNTTYQDIGLSDGSYTYEVTAVDIYSNEGKPSNSALARIYAPVLAQPYTPTGQKTIAINGGNAEANSSIEMTVEAMGSLLIVTAPSDSNGNFTGNAELTLGENRITAKATDSAGNVSRASDMVVVVYNEPPAAPTGLTANINNYDVNLAWNPNSEPDLSGYNLYRNGEKVNKPANIASGNVSASSYAYYNPPLRAFDGDASTYWMSLYSYGDFNPVWLEIALPSAELINRLEIQWGSEPDYQGNEMLYAGKDYEIQVWSGYAWITQTKITGNNANANTFDFKPSYRTDKIRIYITDTTDTNYSKVVRISEVKITRDNLIAPSSYNDISLHDGIYSYRVAAVDYYGFEGTVSDEARATVGDVIPPSAPVNLTASALGSDIILSWSLNTEPDLSGYNVYRNSAQGWVRINAALITGITYTDIGLVNGTYTYRVTAVDNVGNESLPSNEASAIVNIALLQPPVNLRITAVPEGSGLYALWEYTGNASNYNLYRAETTGGPYTKVNAAPVTGTSYLDRGLANGVIYNYVVAALDSVGNESAYSNEASGIASDTIPPAKPEISFPTLTGIPVVIYKDKTDISGAAEPGSTVELFKDGASMGKTTTLENNLVQDIMINYNGDGASVSPDGKTLLYVYNNSIWLEDIAAGNTTQIIQNGYSPLWSPDGRMLAYTFQDNNWNNRIGIYEIETGQSSRLTDDTNVYESAPSWSGDGKKIAFISNMGGLQDVWVKDITTGLFSRATNSGNVTEAKLSPDGNWAAYFEYQNLYLIDLLTGNITPVDTQTDGYSISWSPDSKRFAFASYRSGNTDIFAIDVITKSQIQITNSVNGEFNPVWSPDGRSIIFARQDGSRSSIWVASPNTHEQIVKQNLYNLNYLFWAKSGGIVYIEQNRLNIVYLKGYFNLKDIQLTAGENIFYAIASDSSGNASEPSDRINVVFDTNLMPDLEITAQDIFIYPPYPVAGEDVAIYVAGWNRGKAEVRDIKVDIYLLDSRGNLDLLKSENIPFIAPESAALIELNWNSSDKIDRNSVIAFIDPDGRIYELRETNNLAAKEMFVMGSEGILMETRLNSDRYQANQDVNINVGIKNSGIGRDVTLAVMIEDEGGNIAASLNPVNASLPYATGEEFNLAWNTGSTYAGAYRVHSVLRNASGIIAENLVPFALIYDTNIDSSITTNRANYSPRENVALNVNIKNNVRNYIIPELAVNIKITDSNNNVLFTESRPMKNVMPDVVNALNAVWNTGLSQPGSYNASVDVYNNNQLVSTKTASFIIDSAIIITGNITAAPTIVMHGMSVQVDYTVRNSGNVDAIGLPLRLLVINPEDQSIMNSVENAVDIPINGSQTGQFIFSTQGYKLKLYIVVLQNIYQAGTKSIGSASFTVRDGTSPAINILSPVSGVKYNTGFDIAAVAADDASGVDRVEYQIDNGVWRLLPIADPSTGRYSTTWAPVIADEGVHTISFRAIDKAGNISEPVSTGIIIEVLFGSITAQPAHVYQGKDVTITYSITNNANENIANLNVKVVIVDADAQEIKQTFEIMPNIPMNTTVTGSLMLSTTTLAPKIYLARLEAATAAMSAPKTLATTTFDVKPAIEAAKTMPDITNLLVWVNEKCGEEGREHTVYSSQEKGYDKEDDKEKCIRIDLLENILKQAAASYFIVYDKKDFETQLRNPYYTDILILGDHHPLEDHYANELRELVYSGKGLISSLYLKKGDDHEGAENSAEDRKDEYNTLFGIRYRGSLSGYEHQVNILDSPISTAGTLKAIGEVIKIEANNPEAVAAWIENEAGHYGEQKEYAGIVLNNYGLGRTIFLAFDLGKTINDENYNQMSDLIKNSVAYIHKPVDANAFYPNQLIPVEIKAKSLGGNFDLKITESYPAGIKLYDPLTGKWIADNPWVIDLQLKPDEAKTILYYALLPDRAGAYSLQTEIGYMESGSYNFYQSLSLEIKIEKDIAATTEDVITALKRLTIAVNEKEKLDTAIRYIENIQSRTITSNQDVEKNIHDILKAIESLLTITSTDTASERLMIDRILRIWENRHYFNIY